MNEKRYKLRFLQLFEDDLNEIVDYIAGRLRNPMVADALVDDVQQAIRGRLSCAEAFEQYHSAKERQYPYYRIYVRNYTIFYVVIDDIMEVRRIVYSRRNLPEEI
ncbi:plasmid stabilization system protein ParE [Desulfitobacterium sp. LBE]|uniref:type II toxin-antitoxin system RelE/ParE family toxin n=1 Tax=Desulfitobacterium sp. LBE TaxID=884086 RepID=UPI00119ACDDA|nr:type II toxin-antitoxin system RelE/ParE family toxin [Desulfitobacterium sp. LBE]TWH55921.1 plasmid stabilization system protein ParE [Desulfitobacterium sp. LBE]